MKSKKTKSILLSVIVLLLFVAGYYYVALPAINIHCVGFWYFTIATFGVLSLLIGFRKLSKAKNSSGPVVYENEELSIKDIFKTALGSVLFKITFICFVGTILFYLGGSILSSPIVNAKKYTQLINIDDGNFTEDIKQISYNEIPVLDKDSAILLGSRKMGNMVEYVSQFEVSSDYTQINYKGAPVRVSPLEYGSLFKWFTNQSDGIPAYIQIDMATQNVDCIKLTDGIKYSKSELFNRNIYRHLRFNYPTYIFDDISFEVDDNGTPYWICPVIDYSIGLFGGETLSNVVLVNAITGETVDYSIQDVPTWVDHVYSADLLISYYDYYGTLKKGYLNTLFSQKECLQTTDGYNYIALDDDVWVYTGVTSVGGDESNVGFVLMNQRTAETKYYAISGAEEYSAMSSAEGKVQHLNYVATFPLLLNISNEPTYFIALKDSAGLVKQYAMVNISKYNIVAIGDNITECESTYRELLKTNNIVSQNTDLSTYPSVSGKIIKIAETVIDGNSRYYIMLDCSDSIFEVIVKDNLDIIRYNVGDKITLSYTEGDDYNSVVKIQ